MAIINQYTYLYNLVKCLDKIIKHDQAIAMPLYISVGTRYNTIQ